MSEHPRAAGYARGVRVGCDELDAPSTSQHAAPSNVEELEGAVGCLHEDPRA
jgi:hypothetical protein